MQFSSLIPNTITTTTILEENLSKAKISAEY
jgi:hypothetical protein